MASAPAPSARPRFRRTDALACAAVLAAAALVGTILSHAPLLTGTWEDDGIYLLTGKALAEGRGYRHTEFPGEPWQTKYPILYPLLVAGLWCVAPDYPANVIVARVVGTALWGLGACIAYWLMRSRWGLPWWLCAGGVVLSFINIQMMGLLITAMSEPLYFLLTMLAFWACMPAVAPTHAPAPSQTRRAVLTGLAASAAYLTRGIGLTLLPALLAHYALRRRWKAALITLFLFAGTFGAWRAWCAWAAHTNASNPHIAAFVYDLGYGGWMASCIAQTLWVAQHNAAALALSIFDALIQTPPGWVDTMVALGPDGGGLPLYVAVFVVNALSVLGLVLTFRRHAAAIHLYLLSYILLVVVWPMPGVQRLVLPILPFLTTGMLAGLYGGAALATRAARAVFARTPPADTSAASRPRDLWHPDRPGASVLSRVLPLLIALLGYIQVSWIVQQPGRDVVEQLVRERERIAELIRANTPPDAVIASPYPGDLHLRTGRKFVPPTPQDYVVAYYYPPDRKLSGFGLPTTPTMLKLDEQMTRDRALDHLRQTGATHLLMEQVNSMYCLAFSQVRAAHAREITTVANHERYTLYRLDWAPRPRSEVQ